MLMPVYFSRDLFDDMFDTRFYGRQQGDLMKTDVKETENEYKLSVDLPGLRKMILRPSSKMAISPSSATVNQNNDEKMRKADTSAANVSAGLSTEAFMWAKMYRKTISAPNLKTAP